MLKTGFSVKEDGAELALRFNQLVVVRAAMPEGGINTVEIVVCSIPALLAMKGFALQKAIQAKRRLRHLLLRPQLSGRYRSACQRLSPDSGIAERGGGLRLYRRQV
jgi:hypothetical protein